MMKGEYKIKKQRINESVPPHSHIADLHSSENRYEQLEELSHRYQRELQTIFDSVPAMIFYKDKENRMIRVNNTFAEIMGVPKEKIEGKTCFELYPDQAEDYWRDDEEVIASGIPKRNIIEPLKTPKGLRVVQTDKIPYYDEKGNIIGIIGFCTDITERKQTEDALRESEELYKALVTASPDAIIVTDLEGRIIQLSKQTLRLYGYTKAEELIGTNALNIITPEYNKIAKINIRKTLNNGDIRDNEYLFVKKNGTRFLGELNAAMIKGVHGNKKAFVAIIRDITKRKKAEQEVIRTKEYLKNIINSASEIIIAFNKRGKVTAWNKTAELLTGYKQREIIGRDINKLDLFDNPQELLDNIKNVFNKNEPKWDELVLRTKNDTNRIIRLSYSVIKGEQEQDIGVLIIGENITDEREEHGKLLRGNSYLICDKNNRYALHLFDYLTRSNYNGLYATRTDPSNIDNLIDLTNNQAILFSQDKLREFEHISDLDELTVAIKEFTIKHTNSVILLDRIDYFLNRFSFEQFIDSLYKINDIVLNNKAILLVYLNPSFIDTNRLSMIEEELHLLPGQKIDSILIEDELYNILKFVYEQNQKNSMVFFKKISRELLVDKKTVAKRLKILTDKGLVSIKKQGRLKTVYLSEKGKALFYKRQVA